MAAFTICVYGPKGGVGKTLLATNLAYALARVSRKETLLVDLDPSDTGDMALLLGQTPKSSLADLAPHSHKLNRQLFEHALVNAGKDSVPLLPGARDLSQVSQVESIQVERILQYAQTMFSFVIVDCGSQIHPFNVKAFEKSSLILFCTLPELLPIHRSVQSLADFQNMAFPSDLIQIVLNQFNPDSPITEGMVQQKLKRDCLALLPQDPEEIANSIQEAVPLFQLHPRANYSVVIEDLARVILTQGLLKPTKGHRLETAGVVEETKTSLTSSDSTPSPKAFSEEEDRQADLRMRIHQRLIEQMDFRQLSPEELNRQDEKSLSDLRAKTREVILRIIDQMPEISSREERQKVCKEVLDEALGLGPLEDLLAESSISEILVNRKDQIYVEQNGRLTLSPYRFTSNKHLLGVIERIVAPVGRRIDEKTPMVDARLRDGSRVHAIIPPLAMDGPMLTIRKFSGKILGPEQLVSLGALTTEISDFLRACVQARLNILISGGTGTGKTTLLNVLSSFIPSNERILTVEDAAELKLPQEHVGRLEARPPNLQGEGAIPIRELVRNTLRMRPDRIIVGECRGAEALDMLQAMNTGHDGSMTTIHSNSPRDCLTRLETLVMFAGLDLPSRAIREQIAGAIQLIVQLTRMSDGTRKVTAVSEVASGQNGEINVQDIFLFRQKGVDASGNVQGTYLATGLVPSFTEIFKEKGIALPKSLMGG